MHQRGIIPPGIDDSSDTQSLRHSDLPGRQIPNAWTLHERCLSTRGLSDQHAPLLRRSNDPNDWLSAPSDIIPAIRCIIHVDVEAVRILDSFPTRSSRNALPA